MTPSLLSLLLLAFSSSSPSASSSLPLPSFFHPAASSLILIYNLSIGPSPRFHPLSTVLDAFEPLAILSL